MGTRRYIQKKVSLESVSTPALNPFKTRPFGKGLQARVAELPETDLLQTRPVSSPHQASSQPQEMPDLQTQLDLAERFGYNAANIPVLDPTTAPPIQAKLTIGQVNDPYEQEADRVATQVVEQINSPQTQQASQGQTVQRQDESKDDKEVQMKPLADIQRQDESEEDEAVQKTSTPLPDTVRGMLEVYGPVHYDGLIAAIHAAPVAERQAVLNDANLRALINSRLSEEWATTVMSSLLEGSQEWENPPNNDFFDYFVNKNGQGTLPNTATMNCWESILYAAFLANQISANWIKQFYENALNSGVDPNITIWTALGWSTSLPQYDPTRTKPKVGQLLFYYDQGDPYPGHVAISLGEDQAISLWDQPNNVDAVQRIGVTDLSGIVYIGDPPW